MGETFPTIQILSVEEGLKSGRRGVVCIGFGLGWRYGKVGDGDVLELNMVTVSGKHDVSGFSTHAGMILSIDGSDVVKMDVNNYGPVEDDLEMVFDANDNLLVPLVERLEVARFGGIDAVDRSMNLPGFEPGQFAFSVVGLEIVFRSAVIKNLQLHSIT